MLGFGCCTCAIFRQYSHISQLLQQSMQLWHVQHAIAILVGPGICCSAGMSNVMSNYMAKLRAVISP